MVKRDFSKQKLDLFNTMSGNIPALNDPANDPARVSTFPYQTNAYPSAKYTTNSSGAEPSIRGRSLYIPLNTLNTLIYPVYTLYTMYRPCIYLIHTHYTAL